MATRKKNAAYYKKLARQLEQVDVFFDELRKDKSLPNFGEFFVECVNLGIEDKVNLRVMYPKTYKKVRKFLDWHNKFILDNSKQKKLKKK